MKNYINKDKKKLGFNDYVSTQTLEQRRRERDIKEANAAKQVPDRLSIDKDKKGLKVQNKVYRKQVDVPDPTKVLQMEEEELDEVLQMKINQAKKSVHAEGNTFVAYSIPANNLETVRKAYMSVKLANPRARHIICAWNLAAGGMDHEIKDYQDDEDFGCGCVLLDMMIENNIIQRAIYVARYTNMEKLGNGRFNAYLQAAKNVLEQAPYNHLTKKDQVIQDGQGNEAPRRRKKQGQDTRKRRNHEGGGQENTELKAYTPPTEELLANDEGHDMITDQI